MNYFVVPFAPFERKLLTDTAVEYHVSLSSVDADNALVFDLFKLWTPATTVTSSFKEMRYELTQFFHSTPSSEDRLKLSQVFLNRLRLPFDRNRFRSDIAEAHNKTFFERFLRVGDLGEFIRGVNATIYEEDLGRWNLLISLMKLLGEDIISWISEVITTNFENGFEVWRVIRMLHYHIRIPESEARLLSFCRENSHRPFEKGLLEYYMKCYSHSVERWTKLTHEIKDSVKVSHIEGRSDPLNEVVLSLVELTCRLSKTVLQLIS